MAELDNTAKGFVSVFSSDNLTVPNLMTFLRIILIVPFLTLFISGNYAASFVILAVSGITDFLDGFIARSFNQVSQLGKYLDPLADKLTLFAVGFCVTSMFPKLIPVVALIAAKDILMIIGSLILLKKSINPPGAKWYGKAATAAFYISSLSAVLMYLFDIEMFLLVTVLFSVTFILMLVAVTGYLILVLHGGSDYIGR